MADNAAFITNLYRQSLNRAPDQAGLNYWQQAMGNGMTPNQVATGISATQEGQINGLYGSILERAPDPGGMDYYSEALPQIGVAATRRQMLQSPEYANRIGDDWDFYRSQARQATAGINAMPGVHSDFAAPWSTQGRQGGLPQLQSLLNFGVSQSQPTVPSLSSLLDAAIPEAVKKPAAEKAADKAKPALESLLKDGGVRRSA